MYLAVAVGAVHACDKSVTALISVVKVERAAHMLAASPADICVALLAQLRALPGKQGGVV